MSHLDLLNFVNTLQGSDSRRELSTGNSYPLVGTPRGMTYWTPQTNDGRFLFDLSENTISGIRATHCPSPWMGDYGHFDILPTLGPICTLPGARASEFDAESMIATPSQCQVRLLRYGVNLRFAATSRCAVFEIDFPDSGEAAIVLQTGSGEEKTYGKVQVRKLDHSIEITGISYSNYGGCPDGYGCHFVLEILGEAIDVGVLDENLIVAHGEQLEGPRAGGYVQFESGKKVMARAATSFISIEQARENLRLEIGSKNLAEVVSQTDMEWSRWLGKIQVDGGTEANLRCLATAMYRVGLFPMAGHEANGISGNHYRSPYDGGVHPGTVYTNNGFWDTHRAVYPLLALIDPEGYGEIVDGFLQAYREKGWLPKWASPGYRESMVSTHVDAVISEAILRQIPGFDYKEAYQAIRRNAFDESEDPTLYGRMALMDFDRLGYVPADEVPYSVSRTLDYSHCDWCIAQVARELGHTQDADYLLQRSNSYKNLWSSADKLMRPKLSDGTWLERWEPFSWGGAYIEGGAWQHSFNVPHDPQGLAELHGGLDSLMDALNQLVTMEPEFNPGSYGETIHEMTEMAMAVDRSGKTFGQYAHSNEPVHGYLWLAAALGRGDWTAQQVERVMLALYSHDKLAGDEDNGAMSAWYVLAAIGQYPACPGSGQMVHVPCKLFDRVAPASTSEHSRIDVGTDKLQPSTVTMLEKRNSESPTRESVQESP